MPAPPRPSDAPCGELAGPSLIAALRKVAIARPFARGDVLVREGDPPAFLGLVLEGRVKIVKSGAGGREVILHVMGPDKSFGIVPVLDGEPYPASAVAVEDGRWGRVDAERFAAVLVAEPRIALDVLRSFGRRLRRLAHVTQQAATTPVEARIASRLVELSAPLPPGADVRVTRQELADLAGTTVETAIRVTRAWEQAGIVALSRGRIAIRDPRGLRARAEAS
ncbi:MAG: Crp/Fnr family transcriptional regulator [Deltaproteobacteria bacterium]|nr:Crp/Fnr family transcriptional regulator [Deltaproteobacteria bacterium]